MRRGRIASAAMPIDLSPLPGRSIIYVRDPSDVELPFSKGIMATSLLATGMHTEHAYDVAQRIAERLRAEGVREIAADDLAEVAADEVARGPGAVYARRYLAWRRVKRNPRPLVIALAGVSGVGKSTIATRLALRLGINRVLTTDVVREILRGVVPEAVLPELHVSSFERVATPTAVDPGDPYALQMRAVSAACVAVAGRLVTEGHDVILEGVHLEPGTLRRKLSARPEAPIVIERLLTLEDFETHAARLSKRRGEQPGRSGSRHLTHLDRIRSLQARLIEVAQDEGVSRHDVIRPEGLTTSIVDEVTAAMQVEEPALQ